MVMDEYHIIPNNIAKYIHVNIVIIIKKLENLYLNISLIAIDIGFFAFFKRDFDNLFFDEVAPTVIASTGEIDFIFKSALINPVHNSNIKAKMEQTLHNTVAIEREKPSIYSVLTLPIPFINGKDKKAPKVIAIAPINKYPFKYKSMILLDVKPRLL